MKNLKINDESCVKSGKGLSKDLMVRIKDKEEKESSYCLKWLKRTDKGWLDEEREKE